MQNIWTSIKAVATNVTDTFGGVADVIGGALKGGAKGLAQMAIGMTKVSKGLKGTLEDAIGGTVENYTKAGEEAVKAFKDGAEAMTTKEKIEFVSEEDIQAGVDNIGDWLEEKLGKVKDKMKGFMGSSILATPTGGAPAEGGAPTVGKVDDGTGALTKTLDKKKTLWENFQGWLKNLQEGGIEKFKAGLNEMLGAAQMLVSGLSGMLAAQHEQKKATLK